MLLDHVVISVGFEVNGKPISKIQLVVVALSLAVIEELVRIVQHPIGQEPLL